MNAINHVYSTIRFYWHILIDSINIEKVKFLFILILSIINPIVVFIDSKFIEYLIDGIADSDFSDQIAWNNIIKLVVIVFSISVIGVLCNWILQVTKNKYSKLYSSHKREILLSKISEISYENFENPDFYNQIWMANNAPEKYSECIDNLVFLISNMLSFIFYLIALGTINPIFIFFIISSFVIYLFLYGKIDNIWNDFFCNYLIPSQRKCSYFETVMSDRINHSTIQTNRSLPYFIKKYEENADKERAYTLKLNILSFLVNILILLVLMLGVFGVLYELSQSVVTGRRTIGEFSFVLALLIKMIILFISIVNFFLKQKNSINELQAYEMVINQQTRNENRVELEKILEINDLSYKYSNTTKQALSNISCQFKPGEKIAIVGANGSGKTTFISTILNLLETKTGSVNNGIGSIVAILQDFNCYQLTIKENIELGCSGKSLSDDSVIELLKQVQLYDEVKELPLGINTPIGQLDNGVELSKGQFQRLAIARLLANEEAKIWILDEPTAYLDPISEIEMYKYILSLSKDKLVFFISHRLGFAKLSDRIIVLDDGKLVENGTHSELMNISNGLYSRMYNSQLEWYFE